MVFVFVYSSVVNSLKSKGVMKLDTVSIWEIKVYDGLADILGLAVLV